MELTVKEIWEIEEKELPIQELINHPAFAYVVNETNNITGAVCSIYFRCSNYPTGYLFVGIGKIKDLPTNIKLVNNPYCPIWKKEKLLE